MGVLFPGCDVFCAGKNSIRVTEAQAVPGLVQQHRGEVVALVTRRLARKDVVVMMKWVHWCMVCWLGKAFGYGEGRASECGGALRSVGTLECGGAT